MKSIRTKLWLAIAGVTVFVVLCIWGFNAFFLESIYLERKKNEIVSDTASVAEQIEVQGAMFVDFDQLEEMANKHNYSIKIYNAALTPVKIEQPRGSLNVLAEEILINAKIFYTLSNRLGLPPALFVSEGASGENVYIAGSCIESSTGGIFYVLLASTLAPVSEAMSAIQTQLIFLTAALLILATLVAFVISRSLTKPLRRLSDGATEIARGNLGVSVPVTSRDEIGTLSENFNTMSKEIARVSELQRELIANVSHDIRTPLTMIKGYAEMMRDITGGDPERRDEQLGVIIEESDRLNLLVNDILDLSKLQAGQVALEIGQFNLAQSLRDIVNRFGLLVTSEGFSFELSAPETLIVEADEGKIGQVLYNLIGNAINHTGKDKKLILTLEERGDYARVSIRDTGAGIQREHLPLIWERYYKPYKKDDRKGMGTGLGLSIVKEILAAHHCPFGVSSTEGEGSTFWFEVQKK